MAEAERDIKGAILLRCGALPYVRIWNAPVGRWRSLDGRRVVSVGIEGAADLTGILGCCGRRLEMEVKTPTGRLREAQRAWQRMVERFGGVYILARSAEDAHEALERHRATCEGRPAEVHRGPACDGAQGGSAREDNAQ